MESHLLQMRGLKRYDALNMPEYLVASFTDAWIETSCRLPCSTSYSSRIFYRCVD